MARTFKAGNGRFVRKDSPVAVIGRLREQKERQRRDAERQASRDLIARAQLMRKNGVYVREDA